MSSVRRRVATRGERGWKPRGPSAARKEENPGSEAEPKKTWLRMVAYVMAQELQDMQGADTKLSAGIVWTRGYKRDPDWMNDGVNVLAGTAPRPSTTVTGIRTFPRNAAETFAITELSSIDSAP